MADITALILDEHAWFRQQFARLDYLRARNSPGPGELTAIWQHLADRLEVHAVAEEEIFYPQLLKRGTDPEAETLDAIGDHNEIRDGVQAANQQDVGSVEWWQAVDETRRANDERMAEEEHEGLADFRLHAASGLRESLGRRFAAFLAEHRTPAGLDISDKDPQQYVETIEAELATPPVDGSLGIGSLKRGAR
jgi:Hemerythrin HHE cation binding domain